jgi:ribosomal-protein-alanine N-acetyltransferase
MLDLSELSRRFTTVIPGNNSSNHNNSTLHSDLYFEPLSLKGLPEMHRYSQRPEFYEFLEYEPFYDLSQTEAYIKKLEARMAGNNEDRTANYWFIRRKSDSYLVGSAALVDLSYSRRSIVWGYGVDPDLWGSGYILQIQEILINYVFQILQLNRLSGITMINNLRTIASVQSAGMKYEGTIREFYYKNEQFIDGWQYSMLKSEYFHLLDKNRNIEIESESKVIEKDNLRKVITPMEIIEVISSILTEEEITVDSGMENVMSWDSLNHMHIVIALHEKKGLKLEPFEIARATSVKAITSLLEQKTE